MGAEEGQQQERGERASETLVEIMSFCRRGSQTIPLNSPRRSFCRITIICKAFIRSTCSVV